MEITNTRKILAVLGIIFIIISAYLNLLGILEANSTDDRDLILAYTVSANIVNGIAILCLIVLTFNSKKLSTIYKLIIILVLLSGLVGEYYFLATELYSKNYTTYILLIVNLLVRVYYLVYYFNESWAMFPGYHVAYIKDLEKASMPRSIENVLAPKDGADVNEITDAEVEAFKERWKKLVSQARDKVGRDNFDDPNAQRARSKVIDPAITSRDFSLEKLREAATYLKDKAGREISDLVFGGRKRR